MLLDSLFLRHPREVRMSYCSHAARAIAMSADLVVVAAKLVVHAAVPGLFETCASDMLRRRGAELSTTSGAD